MRSALIVALLLATGCATEREYFPPPESDLPFSSAVRVGDTVYVSGHLGLDPETGRAPADPAQEAEILLDRFGATLERAGVTYDDLVSVQVYCSDVGLYDVWNAAYRERFSGQFPARAFIGSGTLLRGARFEMLGVAR